MNSVNLHLNKMDRYWQIWDCKMVLALIFIMAASFANSSDTTPPVITPPVNVTMEATDANGALVTYAPAMATDNVTASPMISYSKDSWYAISNRADDRNDHRDRRRRQYRSAKEVHGHCVRYKHFPSLLLPST